MKNYEPTSDMKKETYQAPQAENVEIAMGGAGILSRSLSEDANFRQIPDVEEEYWGDIWS